MENAAKYGGDGITVEITSNRLEDGGVELRVKDDGVGVPEAYAEKIFGVFERLDPDDTQTGTGIGLAICRKIVESMGGHIWLAASERGADFRIRLPADSVPQDAASDPASSQEITA
jgi:signal transduction histidine kinase